MNSIIKIIKNKNLKVKKYIIKGRTVIVETNDSKLVIKEKQRNNKKIDIYKYLDSRSFNYYPKIIENNDDYIVEEYVDDIKYPNEQKIIDMIELTGLLHNKTTHFKEVDYDDYKEIYEDIKNNISYLTSYYNDYMNVIDSSIIMSPSEYLLARNITIVYESLGYCEREIDRWYELIKDKRRIRKVVVHNNLKLEHFRKDKKSYLLSWDKSKIDIPIFDMFKLYRAYNLDYDFNDILNKYERNYPLNDDERLLLFVLISLPHKIEFDNNEYRMCTIISKEIDYLYKTREFISPYYSKETEKNYAYE